MIFFKGNREKLNEEKIKNLEDEINDMRLANIEVEEERQRSEWVRVTVKKWTEIPIVSDEREKILEYRPMYETESRSGFRTSKQSEALILDYNYKYIGGVKHGSISIMACNDFPYEGKEVEGESVEDALQRIERLNSPLQAKYVLLKEVSILTNFLTPGSSVYVESSLTLYEL